MIKQMKMEETFKDKSYHVKQEEMTSVSIDATNANKEMITRVIQEKFIVTIVNSQLKE